MIEITDETLLCFSRWEHNNYFAILQFYINVYYHFKLTKYIFNECFINCIETKPEVPSKVRL